MLYILKMQRELGNSLINKMLLDSFANVDDLANKKDEEILAMSVEKPNIFEVLVDRYQEAFLRKARSVIGDKDDIHDIVQEAFAKIYFNANRFKVVPGASFKSWAYKILMNVIFTHYGKLKKDREALADIDPEFYAALPDKNDLFKKDFVRDFVESILTRMPKDLASVLKMHFIDGLAHKEIADAEGITVGAVKTRVYRAKREFKNISEDLS